MSISASKLRENIYQLLDQVAQTSVPLEIERKGTILQVVVKTPASKLDRLVRREGVMQEDPEDYVHIEWTS